MDFIRISPVFHEYPFQDPIQDTTLHLVITFSVPLESQTVSPSFLALHDLDTFQKYRSGVLLIVSLSEFVWCFPKRSWVEELYHRGSTQVKCVRVCMASTWFIVVIALSTGVCQVSPLYSYCFSLHILCSLEISYWVLSLKGRGIKLHPLKEGYQLMGIC